MCHKRLQCRKGKLKSSMVAMETKCFDCYVKVFISLFTLNIIVFIKSQMPLFNNKFSPKTIPVRRQESSVIKKEFGSDYAAKELSIEINPLKLKLGDFEISFEDGHWIPASGKAGAAHKENIRLKKEMEQLEEENNMLRLKFEILLDMLTEQTLVTEETDGKGLKNKSRKK